MKFEFNDTATIEVNTDLLTCCDEGQYFETKKRSIGKKNLFWWLRCYPNGSGVFCGSVDVSIHTSFGGFSIRHVTTIDRSDVKKSGGGYYKEPLVCNHSLSPHFRIKSGSIIQNNVFVIRCKVNFKIALDEPRIDHMKNFMEDSAIIKLNRKTLESYDLGDSIVGEKRTIADMTWWTKYYPCGVEFENDYYNFDVFFNFTNAPEKTHFSCGLLIGGAFVQKSFDSMYSAGRAISFSHKQLQNADHENDVVDLVCKVSFNRPTKDVPKNPTLPLKLTVLTKPTTSKTCYKDSVAFSILECQLTFNEVGDFGSTPKRFVTGSDKHQWRVLYFPVGVLAPPKGFISLIVEASTTETKTVFLTGEITIRGTPFSKKFKMLVEEDSNIAFPKLISHEELRRIGGIVDQQVIITCDVTFEDHVFEI
uniref:MATH domain-containing protein n=1 Tax=Panagrellus redivivus TaxID=6233 RepID=A0A7E4VMN0_PANRE